MARKLTNKLPNKGLLSCLFILSVLGITLLPSLFPLQAQTVDCQGAACPPTALLNSVRDSFEQEYGLSLADSFANAHAIANVGAIPYIGGISLNFVTVGAQLNAGIEKSEKMDFSNLTGAELGGVVPVALIYGGVNLGILKVLPGLNELEALKDIDVYVGKLKIGTSYSDVADIDRVKTENDTLYLGIRYQMVDPISIPILLTWQGISIQYGYVTSSLDITVEDEDDSSSERLGIPGFEWLGENKIVLDSEVNSHVIGINTGFRLLFFLSLTVGGGFSYHSGETNVDISREGNLYLTDTEVDARLRVAVNNKDELETYRLKFYKAGLEFNIPFLRFGVEGTVVKNSLYSVSVGTRIDI